MQRSDIWEKYYSSRKKAQASCIHHYLCNKEKGGVKLGETKEYYDKYEQM